MFNRHRDRDRNLVFLALGLGLMALRGKRRFRRYVMAQMLGRAFAPGAFGRFGGEAPWTHGDITNMPVPPFIDARLKAWHDKAHGNAPAAGPQPTDVARV